MHKAVSAELTCWIQRSMKPLPGKGNLPSLG